MRRTAAALALALAACSRHPSPGPAPAAGAAGGAQAAAMPGTPASGSAYVSVTALLRREPTEAARVPAPAGKGRKGKELSNVLTVLQRGERVSVLETRGDDWAKVRTSDDQDGWLRRSGLVEGDVTVATVLVPTDVFDRPDLLAANARRRIDPGTLVLVVRRKEPFSEVNVSSGPDAWVLSDRLSTAEREVSVAKLTEKARALVRGGKPDEAKQLLALARQSFPGSPLLDDLAVELGEAPAAPPAVPAAAGAPAPAAAPIPASAPSPGAAPVQPAGVPAR